MIFHRIDGAPVDPRQAWQVCDLLDEELPAFGSSIMELHPRRPALLVNLVALDDPAASAYRGDRGAAAQRRDRVMAAATPSRPEPDASALIVGAPPDAGAGSPSTAEPESRMSSEYSEAAGSAVSAGLSAACLGSVGTGTE